MVLKKHLTLLSLVSLFSVANARELNGANVAESLELEGQKFTLQGAGIRSKFFVKVYVGGLYLYEKSSKSQDILESSGLKAIKLHFSRNVEVDKIRTAWSEGFANNCTKNCDSLRKELDKVNAAMSDMKEKETLTFYLAPDKVSVYKNDQKKSEVLAPGLAREILAIFIGNKPADKELKKGMLGL